MNEFKPSKILSAAEAVAEQLRQKREEKDLKLKDIAKRLNIKYEYLKALEDGELEKLPAGIYGKNFLREYAAYLGLNYKELAKGLQGEKNIGKTEGRQEIFSSQVIKRHNFLVFPKIIRSIIIAVVVFVCFIYLGFYLKRIISPPVINITEPPDNLITTNNFVIVLGETEPEAQVTINGELIPSGQDDKDGFFSKRVNLKSGFNIITITAKNKYGREETIERQILVNN